MFTSYRQKKLNSKQIYKKSKNTEMQTWRSQGTLLQDTAKWDASR